MIYLPTKLAKMIHAEGLNLFQTPLSDVSVISRHDTDYYPSDAVPNNSKETIQVEVINKSVEDFIDLNSTEIHLSLQICNKADGTKLDSSLKDAKYGICNNFGHAMFKQITLQEGDVEMNNSTGTYPYQVDFENSLMYDDKDVEARPRLEGFIPDTASAASMGKLFAADDTNAGLTVRSKMFDDGKIAKVIIKPHLGPLAQKRFLLPNTRIILKMIPNSDDFLLTYDDTATKKTYGVFIKHIKVRVRTVKLDRTLSTQIYRNLQKGHAVYPTPTPTMSTAIIENGISNWEKDNIFGGKLPKLFMFAIVENAAYNGSRSKNPFFYKNLGITEAQVKLDGVPIVPPVNTDFAKKEFQEAYVQILKATNDKSCLLNANTWDVKNIWVFDLTPKGSHSLDEYYPARAGNLRLELKFSAAIAEGPYTIIFYGLVDSTSEIDSQNNVIKNW